MEETKISIPDMQYLQGSSLNLIYYLILLFCNYFQDQKNTLTSRTELSRGIFYLKGSLISNSYFALNWFLQINISY